MARYWQGFFNHGFDMIFKSHKKAFSMVDLYMNIVNYRVS